MSSYLPSLSQSSSIVKKTGLPFIPCILLRCRVRAMALGGGDGGLNVLNEEMPLRKLQIRREEGVS